MSDTSTQPSDTRADLVRGYRPIADLIPAHWARGHVSANGIRQHYYRTGGGRPPALLLHGFMEGALVWLPTARALESEYDVIMLDARGHGGSDRAGDDYAPETLAADVAAAIDALGPRDLRLLGFSQGATTAALVADRRPDVVRALVLAGLPERAPAFDITSAPGYQSWLSAYTAWLEGLKTQEHTERMVASLSQLPPSAPLLPEEEYVAWVENSASLDLDLVRIGASLWRGLDAMVRAMDEAIAGIACPMLIMKSSMLPHSSGPLTLREEPSGRPNVTVLHFENTGHLIYRDRFDAFIAQVRAFFDRV